MPARRPRARRLDLLTEFWFLTSLVALGGPVLAAAVLAIDGSAGAAGILPGLAVSPDSARTILGSISGSLITIASLTSSLTIVTLQLLSNQYTPRTVRGFLATRRSQVVLGTFIAIFLYCLVLLVSVREPADENDPFVPSLGIVLAVVLAVVGLIVLVLFIHSMSQTIQVSTTAARIARDTHRAIERVHGADVRPGDADSSLAAVRAETTGYVRAADAAVLLQAEGILVVTVRPGDFVTPATVLARVERPTDGDVIQRAVPVEHERDIAGDPSYGIRQLADIALRALSPGINDPSTAVTCVGYLRALIEDVAARALPDHRRLDARVVVASTRFEDYLGPLVEIAGYAGSDARAVWSLLDALDSIAERCVDTDRAMLVREVREEVRAAALPDARLERDQARLRPREG